MSSLWNSVLAVKLQPCQPRVIAWYFLPCHPLSGTRGKEGGTQKQHIHYLLQDVLMGKECCTVTHVHTPTHTEAKHLVDTHG